MSERESLFYARARTAHLQLPIPGKPGAWRLACGANMRTIPGEGWVRELDGEEPVTCEQCRRRYLHIPVGFAEAS